MPHFGQERREATWGEARRRRWDVVVVGGGIVGADIAKGASRTGLSVLLLEARDFASGTSGRSSKMIHGGLRYLRERRIRLTREAVRERERLLRTGRGLVDPLPFLYLVCEGDRSPSWLVGLGLAAYDLLDGRASNRDSLAVRDLALFAPNLILEDVRGGYRYLDAATDDARLVLRVLREAAHLGARALNYAPVEGLVRDAGGTVRGVVARDAAGGGRAEEIRAGVVVNATGAWARELAGPDGLPFVLRPLRGSHLVLPWERLPVSHAVAFVHPRDDRPVFAYPWEGVTLVGTTDLDHTAPLYLEPAASEEEVGYLLDALRARFRDPPDREHLLGTFAGVRPVISGGEEQPSREPREHVVWGEKNLVTVTGGKLTTFRPMARRGLGFVLERAGGKGGGEGPPLEPIPEPLVERAQEEELRALPHLLRRRLAGRLGPDLADFLGWAEQQDLDRIAGTPYTWAELRWAAKREAVVHLDDLLLRRARLGHLLPDGASALEEEMERRVRPLLGWTQERWEAEWARYRGLWEAHYGPEPLPRR